MRNPSLYIAQSALGGRGVFTGAPIKKGDMFEVCPVIVMKEGEIIERGTHEHLYNLGREYKKLVDLQGIV